MDSAIIKLENVIARKIFWELIAKKQIPNALTTVTETSVATAPKTPIFT